jgi:peroxiredoxin Q/BCP
MAEIAVGSKAPDFSLPADDGETVVLSKLKGKIVVIYFYPKDDTSGCTREAVDFTALQTEFAKSNALILGISPDTVSKHVKFKSKHDLGVTLLADPDLEAIGSYGVWVEKSMYGKKYMGVERSTFLIGKDGNLAKSWHKVKVPGHAEAVLAEVRDIA